MKKHIKILIATIIVSLNFSLNSCENFLTTDSKSTFVEPTVFANIDFARNAILGIYAPMMTNGMWLQSFLFLSMDNDIEISTGTPDNARRACARYEATEGADMIEGTWTTLYQAIERANIAIDNLGPGTPLWDGPSSTEARALYGEAVALRAMFYYHLITIFGDVPWAGESFKEGVPFFKPKTDRDEIYKILIEDLKRVQEFVPWNKGKPVRVGKGFIKGLRVRMLMQYAGYSLRNVTHETLRGQDWEWALQEARDEAYDFIFNGPHEMNPNYEDIWRKIHRYTWDTEFGENLFQIPFGRGVNSNFGNHIGMATFQDNPIFGRTAIEIGMPTHVFYSYDIKDYRRHVNAEFYRYNATATPGRQMIMAADGVNFRHTKWRKEWLEPRMGGADAGTAGTGINFPVMRFTDVVLLFAEAENELNNGPTELAREALRKVRRRAFPEELWPEKVNAYVAALNSRDAFFNALVDERAWEFHGELIRKQDLVRWNLLGAKLNKALEECWKLFDDHEDYRWVPNYIFYRYLPAVDGIEKLDIYNLDQRLDPSLTVADIPRGAYPDIGWTRATWFAEATETSITSGFVTNFVDRMWIGYDYRINNHLTPIARNIINDSRGYLTNCQIPERPSTPLPERRKKSTRHQ